MMSHPSNDQCRSLLGDRIAVSSSLLGGYDEPVILPYAMTLVCPIGADVRQSDHIGTTPIAIPGLFAAMFAARQGFMFGLIYGAAVCRNADVPMDVFVEQLPLTLKATGLYAETFRRTVPGQSYDSAEATLETYLAALNGIVATFEETETVDDFPRLMRDLTQRGFDEGNSAKDLTVLVETLSKKS